MPELNHLKETLKRLNRKQAEIDTARIVTPEGLYHVPEHVDLPVEFKVERWDSEDDYLKGLAPSLVTRDGAATYGLGAATNVGSSYLWMRAYDGTLGTDFDATNSYLGVGSDSTAFAATQTALVSQTGSRKSMDSDYPKWGNNTTNTGGNHVGTATADAQKMQWKSTFGSSDGNAAWNEFGIFNGATAPGSPGVPTGAGIMVDRFVSTQGTKASGQVWALTITVTLT